MSSLLRSSKLIESCPPSLDYDAQVRAACAALDEQMYEIIDETDPAIAFIPNIMALGEDQSDLVDVLAWQFHVEGYDAARGLEFRKNLVQLSIQWHRTKGTVALVQQVIDTYWPGGATLQEWFEYKNPLPPNYPESGWHDRYLFRILVNQAVISPSDEAAVLALVNRYKPVSRWCETILRSRTSTAQVYGTGYCQQYIIRKSARPTHR